MRLIKEKEYSAIDAWQMIRRDFLKAAGIGALSLPLSKSFAESSELNKQRMGKIIVPKAEPQLIILANCGDFASIEEAAYGEKKVDWWDGDLTDDRACTECFAAVELRNFLAECLGISRDKIRLENPIELPPKGNVFLIGSKNSNPLIAKNSNAKKLKNEQSYHIKAFEQSGRIITVIEGQDRIGTLYGIYAYLEELGVRFYGLGDTLNPNAGKIVPVTNVIQEGKGEKPEIKSTQSYRIPSHGTVMPAKKVKLPSKLNINANPSFLIRGFWAWEAGHGNEEFFMWMARNKMNLWTAADKRVPLLKKLGMKLIDGGHNIQQIFLGPRLEYPYKHSKIADDENKAADPYPVSNEFSKVTNKEGKLTYFGAHPEWYGLYDGKRSDNIAQDFGDNYCTSNKDATQELAKNLIESLIGGRWKYVDVINFWMLDSERKKANWCQCKNCKRIGTPTDRLMKVADTVLKAIKAARKDGRLNREIHISTIAYQETIEPPTKDLPASFDYGNFSVTFYPIERCYVHPLADKRCEEINKFLLKNYQAWTKGKNRKYKGAVAIGEYYNVSSLKSMPVVFTNIMSKDLPWYYRTGTRYFNYMHTPTRRWGTWTVNQRLLAKLLWNHKENAKAVLMEYFRLYYPTTHKAMAKFYKALEAGLANVKAFKHTVYYANSDDSFYMLRRNLADEKAEIFPMKHLKYNKKQSSSESGPSIVEMADYIREARIQIDAAMKQCDNELEKMRLTEDLERFEYGEMIVFFYYHLVRTAIFHRERKSDSAREEFGHVKDFAKRLENITDIVNVASSHGNAINGFKTALHWPVGINPYEYFNERYGKPQQAGG